MSMDDRYAIAYAAFVERNREIARYCIGSLGVYKDRMQESCEQFLRDATMRVWNGGRSLDYRLDRWD